MSVLGTSKVTQIAIVVKDINLAIKNYAEFLGVPAPNYIVTAGYEQTQSEYKGNPCYGTAKLAFFNVNEGLALELIEPDEKPSTWREFLDTHGEGVHHIAFSVKDTADKIKKAEELGWPCVQKGEYEGGRYSYIDASKDLKVILETLEND